MSRGLGDVYKRQHFVTFDVAKIGQGHEDECYRNVIVRLIKRVS